MTFFIIHHFQESRHQLVSLPTLPIKSVGESFFNNFFYSCMLPTIYIIGSVTE